MKRRIIGLTGGIASGKSSVVSYLKENNDIEVLDADLIARELMEPGARGWRIFRNDFGDIYLNPDRTVNRPLLRHAVFHDEATRLRLNKILHPLVKEVLGQKIKNATSCATDFLVEVPLLFEAQWEKDFDKVIVVYADYQCCLERLINRDNISPGEARVSLDAQWPLSEKALKGTHVVDNSGYWLDTCLQLSHLGRLLWPAAKL